MKPDQRTASLPEIVAVSTVDLADRRESFVAMVQSLPSDVRLVVVVRGSVEVDEDLRAMLPSHTSVIRVPTAGLSRARNLALREIASWELADSAVIAFPDDDCTWDRSTGPTLQREFVDPALGLLLGRYRPVDEDFLPDVYPSVESPLSPRVVMKRSASIIVFTRVSTALQLYFDEELGVGARYPSAEDSDFALRALALCGSGRYAPDVVCYHRYEHVPDPSRKIIAGYIMARHLWTFPSLMLPTGRWLLRRLRHGPNRQRAFGLVVKGLTSPKRHHPVH
jgi:hypothetical protein